MAKNLAIMAVFYVFGVAGAAALGAEQNIASFRHEREAADPTIQVSGRLICDLGSENNGQACSLRLEEDGTGRIFRLRAADSVMRLYFDGARRATVQGRPDRDALIVKAAERL